MARQAEYSNDLCGCNDSDGGTETSVFYFKCADWCMCGMYGNVVWYVCNGVSRNSGTAEWKLPQKYAGQTQPGELNMAESICCSSSARSL